ncbi:DUF4142 domain-containing protein [Telluribacter sp.]|jgi:putative membrane protein|uniref:DUF4142 domain-containing protein n=1 Tax=Telluribacter sp. TaxID=1978767 RepID=UPI002E139E38|nr:DUF4142 domain-containing protein [Telluribacter sp.]
MKKNLLSIMLVAALLSATSCADTDRDSQGGNELAHDIEEQDLNAFDKDGAGPDGTAATGERGQLSDEQFATQTAEGSMLEIQLGNLAQQNGSSQQVKQFGQHMVKEHSAMNQNLKTIATGKGFKLPTTPSQQGMDKYTRLAAQKGVEFDRAYAQMMVESHQKTIQMFMDYSETTGIGGTDENTARTGTNSNSPGTGNENTSGAASTQRSSSGNANQELRSLALKNIPILQQHLEMAQRLQQPAGNTTNRPNAQR